MEYTVTFGPSEFDGWALYGMCRDEEITEAQQHDLFANCLYLCEAEQRTLAQTHEELRDAISSWAEGWNKSTTGA